MARYYDPASAQFLTVDPKVATTLSPYGYVAGDPVNATDPTGKGLCFIWQSNCQTGAQRVSSFVSNLCIRTGGGNWNSNVGGSLFGSGECQTELSSSQGTKAVVGLGFIAAGIVLTGGLADAIGPGLAPLTAAGAETAATEETFGAIDLLIHAPFVLLPGGLLVLIGGVWIYSAATGWPGSSSGSSGSSTCP